MARGDHICVRRLLYWHHGIDCGDGTAIHYSGSPLKRSRAIVERVALDVFTKGRAIRLVQYDPAPSAEDVMQRAESRLEESRYHLLFNNCEHFARWCMTGIAESKQVKSAVRTMFVAASVIIVGGIATVVAAKARRRA